MEITQTSCNGWFQSHLFKSSRMVVILKYPCPRSSTKFWKNATLGGWASPDHALFGQHNMTFSQGWETRRVSRGHLCSVWGICPKRSFPPPSPPPPSYMLSAHSVPNTDHSSSSLILAGSGPGFHLPLLARIRPPSLGCGPLLHENLISAQTLGLAASD